MTRRRRGFTLVEILVALALTVFILSILSQAFVTGADTFRTLKSIGDMNASLRIATTMLRNDLSAAHFEGKRRLSDPTFWTQGSPQQGYFFLDQRNAKPPILPEATDANQILSYRVTGTTLAFTVRADGNRQENFYAAKVPVIPLVIGNDTLGPLPVPDARYQDPGTFTSQWMEVCYFLQPVQGGVNKADGTTPLYALYRQQRLVVADNQNLNWRAAQQIPMANLLSYQPAISCQVNPDPNPAYTAAPGPFIYFNNPADLTIPQRRVAGTDLATGTSAFKNEAVAVNFTALKTNVAGQWTVNGNDLLLTDVISFDVKALLNTNLASFADLPNPNYFDTGSTRNDDVYGQSAPPNQTYRILALQITIRLWDPRTKLSRQISIIQDM